MRKPDSIEIYFDENGDVSFSAPLSDEDRLKIGLALFDEQETDNDGQILFYTGIFEGE